MEWSRKSVQVLIQAFKDEPALFDHRHPQYHSKSSRKEKIENVALKVEKVLPGVSPNDCKTKFATLRSHYGAELKKIRANNETGTVYTPTVWWFPLMDFLKSQIIPRMPNIPEKVLPHSHQSSMDSSQSTDLMDCSNLSDEPQLQIVESRSTDDTADSGSDNHSELSTEIVEVKHEIDIYPTDYATTDTQDVPETHGVPETQGVPKTQVVPETQGVPEPQGIPETQDVPEAQDVTDPLETNQSGGTQHYYERPPKRQKKDEDDTLLLSTLTMVEKVSSYLERTSEDDTLAKFVAEELRKMDNYICIKTRAKHRILHAIMDAQMEIIREIQKTEKSNI